MREDEATGSRGRASEYTPAGDSNRSTSTRLPIKAVIFDIGNVVVGVKYHKLYKYIFYTLHRLHQTLTKREDDDESFLRLYRSTSRLNNHVIEIVRELKAAGYGVHVLSNAEPRQIKAAREFGAYDHFEKFVLSSEVGFKKPDRRIYEHALRRFKLQPEECVFVDDKEENLAPAREMGMRTVLFKSAKQLRKDLKRHGVVIG